MNPRNATVAAIVLLSAHGAALRAEEPNREIRAIEVWTRPPGDAAAADLAKLMPIRVAAFKARRFDRVDPQYGKRYTFNGIPLAEMIDRARPPAGSDLALLHFGNGMVIPLPFRDAAVMKRLDPMLALSVAAPDGKAQPLPVVTRKAREYVDIPAIRFDGNKLVVAEAFHPMLAATTTAWSPWPHADSLVAIEFVAARPYYAQFDVGTTDAARAGFALFKENCQFCHGARQVGAKLGWDFVEPLPIYTWRGSSHQLYLHVALRRLDAPERNEMMPALKHMTEADTQQLWQWLQAIGTQPMRPYLPDAVALPAPPAGPALRAAAVTR